MIMRLGGLADYTIDSVVSAMETLGYDVAIRDIEGPLTKVCMSKPGLPEHCTRIEEGGAKTNWSASQIASEQDSAYQDMYGDEIQGGSRQVKATKSYPVSLRFVNTSTGNSSTLYVGDSWVIEVAGDPNASVLSSGSGPGGSWSGTSHGRTNSSGVLRITGKMSDAEIGNWSQTWTVGGKRAGSISFTVKAKTVAETVTKQAASTSDIIAQNAVAEVQVIPTAVPDFSGLLSNKWVLIGGAAALLLIFGRGR